jgi:4-hydroxy-3-methylbut-2-enyl diphosphate reductase
MGVSVDRVLLAQPRGFCAGVEMAIKALTWMVRVFEPPVYCYHEIVHNQVVVERFRRLGVVFVEGIDEVPPGAPLMLSAHGTAPAVVEAARQRAGTVVNAVCPLVTKVHHEVKTRAKAGYTILYVGHAGHEEAIGTTAVAPDAVHLVEAGPSYDPAALEVPEGTEKLALIAQTTLSHDEWADIMEAARRRYPEVWLPGRSDLCFATTNRQLALRAVADRADAVVVLGSANSSNTVALEKVARSVGVRRVLRINGADELPADLTGVVAVTAGASAPEELVEEVVARLAPKDGVEEVAAVDEDEYFPPPRELRELLRGITVAAGLLFGQPAAPGGPLADDRGQPAAQVLDRLDHRPEVALRAS